MVPTKLEIIRHGEVIKAAESPDPTAKELTLDFEIDAEYGCWIAARVQGSKLKAKREIRVASLFKHVPEDFLKMIAVHELAHLKERQHDKAFYKLCGHMEPDYHQLEFDVRLYLTHLDLSGERLWAGEGAVDTTE